MTGEGFGTVWRSVVVVIFRRGGDGLQWWNSGELGVFSGVERLGKSGGGLLGFWVDLGDEMEENGWLGRAWFQGEKERGRLLNSEGEEGGVWWGILSGFQLSLSDGKRH